jgi:hypothetical protein
MLKSSINFIILNNSYIFVNFIRKLYIIWSQIFIKKYILIIYFIYSKIFQKINLNF